MPHDRIDPLQESGTQHIIVLQLLRKNHQLRWTRAELERKLNDVNPTAIGVALERLREHGVVHTDGKHVSASPCARHMDALGFICI